MSVVLFSFQGKYIKKINIFYFHFFFLQVNQDECERTNIIKDIVWKNEYNHH